MKSSDDSDEQFGSLEKFSSHQIVSTQNSLNQSQQPPLFMMASHEFSTVFFATPYKKPPMAQSVIASASSGGALIQLGTFLLKGHATSPASKQWPRTRHNTSYSCCVNTKDI